MGVGTWFVRQRRESGSVRRVVATLSRAVSFRDFLGHSIFADLTWLAMFENGSVKKGTRGKIRKSGTAEWLFIGESVCPSGHKFNVTHTRSSYPKPMPIHINNHYGNIELLVFRRLSLLLGLLLNLCILSSPTPSLPTRLQLSLSLTTSANPLFPFLSMRSSSGSINRWIVRWSRTLSSVSCLPSRSVFGQWKPYNLLWRSQRGQAILVR